jgi:hypothetical protein
VANTFLTAAQISGLAVQLLNRSLMLPNTISKIPGAEYGGPNGGTVTVMVPTPLAAREQVTPGTQITWDDVAQTPVDVTVKHLYSAVKVTDEELTMSLADYGRDVLMNQVTAVATAAEDQIAAAMNAVAVEDSFATTATDADTIATLLGARQALTAANVPPGDRFLAVSADIATRLLTLEGLVRADASGSDSALREGTIGRIFGFTVVESNALTAGTALAYHRSGFTWANFPPTGVSAQDGVDIATSTAGGVSLRNAIQWLPDFLSKGSVVQTFAGAAQVQATRVFKLGTTAP